VESEARDRLRGRSIAFVCLTSQLVEDPKSDMTESEKHKSPFFPIARTLLVGLGGGGTAMAFLHPSAPKSQDSDSASSASKSEDLISSDGRQKLKDQILNPLHHCAGGLGALEVHYTELLMQR
jgi:hypothetical protein